MYGQSVKKEVAETYQIGAFNFDETRQTKIDRNHSKMSTNKPIPMPRINAIDYREVQM